MKRVKGFGVEELTIRALCKEAAAFAETESCHDEPTLFGAADGKTIGTYLERKFADRLRVRYSFVEGNPASGIDFPDLDVDVKVTSSRQPQSSCPFRTPRQKIYGLGYHLIVFVYEKSENIEQETARLDIVHVIFVKRKRTADHHMTRILRQILDDGGNEDDIVAIFQDRNLPVDDIDARNLAEEILQKRPRQGYLTISNALQWRLQYGHVMEKAGEIRGVKRIR